MAKKKPTLTPDHRKGKALMPDPKNARLHPDDNQDMIARSLKEVGTGRSIVADADGIIRAGNGVYAQAQKLGIPIEVIESDGKKLIAIKRTDLKGDKAIRLGLYDNMASDKSLFDAIVLQELAELDSSLLEGIISDTDLLNIIARAEQGGSMVNLNYDQDGVNGFAEGAQFKDYTRVNVILHVTREQFDSPDFKKALETFATKQGVEYRTQFA